MSQSTLFEPGASTLAYQIYVELEEVRPKVWRRFLVPDTIELPRLHVTLLWGTGWDGGHIHEFEFIDANYCAQEPNSELPDGVLDEEGVTLREALGRSREFRYIYDYGDAWWHKVKVEKTVALAVPIALAICVGGENACPPEDIRGAPGYEEFLEIMADPEHPEHAEQKAWIGRDFDPKQFSVEETNRRLTPEVY
jgi:hypothetical protein